MKIKIGITIILVMAILSAGYFVILRVETLTSDNTQEESVTFNPTIQPKKFNDYLAPSPVKEFEVYGEVYALRIDWDGDFTEERQEVFDSNGELLFTYFLAINGQYIDKKGVERTIKLPIVVQKNNGEVGLVYFRNNQTPSNPQEIVDYLKNRSKKPDGTVRAIYFTLVKDYKSYYQQIQNMPAAWFGDVVTRYYEQNNNKVQFERFLNSGETDLGLLIPQGLTFSEI